MTLIEAVITLSLLFILMGGFLNSFMAAQDAFVEGAIVSRLQLKARSAMDRLVRMAGKAVTGDTMYSPLKPTTGVGSHCLRFRMMQSVNPITGDPIYDDTLRVYLYGPDTGTSPNRGLIIGRGIDLPSIHAAASGPDNLLGTTDDNNSLIVSGGIPAVELLIPESLAPQAGSMFTVDVEPPPFGRLLTFTLRLNTRGKLGNFLLPSDLVLTERVALRQ